MTNLKTSAISFNSVKVKKSGLSILSNITASIPKGSQTAIVGPNGAGKTTLLSTILQKTPYEGEITYPSNPSPVIGYVPQKFNFDRNMPINVIECLTMNTQNTPIWLGVKKEKKEKALNLLDKLGASYLANRKLGSLSGGEMQRVLLSLALQRDPDILIMDEPSAGVDFSGDKIFCELLDKIREERNFTQVIVTHDLAMVTHHSSHVICLNKKVIAEGPPEKTLSPKTLNKLFGIHMGLINSASMPKECTHN